MADKTLTENGSSDFSFSPRNATTSDNNSVIGLPMIQTQKKVMEVPEICHDDSTPPVRAQTIDELHSLPKKRSTPNTPIRTTAASQQHKQVPLPILLLFLKRIAKDNNFNPSGTLTYY
jgi:phosphoenolpyruvate carboxykinase (ATP)